MWAHEHVTFESYTKINFENKKEMAGILFGFYCLLKGYALKLVFYLGVNGSKINELVFSFFFVRFKTLFKMHL